MTDFSDNSDSQNPQDWLQQPHVQDLIAQGASSGQVTYGLINEVLGDLDLDPDFAEALLEALENRAIKIVDDPVAATPHDQSQAHQGSPQAAPSTAIAKAPMEKAPTEKAPVRRGGHSDLDDVLASLEALSRDSAVELMAIADSEIAKEEAEEEAEPSIEDSFRQYSARISQVPLLSPEEELRLARLARNGTPTEQTAAKQQLVEANLRLVISIALRRAGAPTLPLMDIVQEGNIGLIRAVDRFNPERGQKLSSYATWWIRQSINRAITEQARSMRLPGHLYEAIETVQRVRRELEQNLNRQPSKQELAAATNMTPVQVDEALRAATRPVSLERPVGEEEDVELGEIISDPNADTAEASFSRTELHDELGRVLQTLPERERTLVMKRFGLGDYESGGPQNLDDIADAMKLSRERVRQLELRALRKLRRAARGTSLAALFGAEDGDE